MRSFHKTWQHLPEACPALVFFAQTIRKESSVLIPRAQGHAKNVWFSAQRHARGDMQEMFGLARNGPPHESKPNDLFRVRFVHRAVGACEA